MSGSGVSTSEAQANAVKHVKQKTATAHGVSNAEAQTSAVENSQYN